jgi:hypothetical protein
MTVIVCSGDHPTPVVLGSYTAAPNGPTTHAGMLCDDCGTTYAEDVASGTRPAGTIPRRANVDAYLARHPGKTRRYP